MLVDLARNDVGRVVDYGTETVDELMTLERYSHVMHLTSQVSGRLRAGLGPDRRAAGHPAGRHRLGRAEGAGHGDHRRARAGQAGPVRRRHRLLRLLRQPRHRHRHPHHARRAPTGPPPSRPAPASSPTATPPTRTSNAATRRPPCWPPCPAPAASARPVERGCRWLSRYAVWLDRDVVRASPAPRPGPSCRASSARTSWPWPTAAAAGRGCWRPTGRSTPWCGSPAWLPTTGCSTRTAGGGERGPRPAQPVQAAHQGRARAVRPWPALLACRGAGVRSAGPAGDRPCAGSRAWRRWPAPRRRATCSGPDAGDLSARTGGARRWPAATATTRPSASRAGIPRMGAELTDKTIPGETGLIERTVSFTKGCYTGQELVARIDSRGGNVPRHLRRLVPAGRASRPAPTLIDGRRQRRHGDQRRPLAEHAAGWRSATSAGASRSRPPCGPAPTGQTWRCGSCPVGRPELAASERRARAQRGVRASRGRPG